MSQSPPTFSIPTIKITPPSPTSTAATETTTTIKPITTTTSTNDLAPHPLSESESYPSTVACLLEEHKRCAAEDLMLSDLYHKLWLSQGRLPSKKITPAIIRIRIAHRAALAHAEGLRHAKEVLEDEQENYANSDNAMERLMVHWQNFLIDVNHAEKKAKRKARLDKIKLKSALKTPRTVFVAEEDGRSQTRKTVLFADPVVSAPEGTGNFSGGTDEILKMVKKEEELMELAANQAKLTETEANKTED
ncbi:hypothetical protein EDC01DRAFT_636983 [Geopyxis carbonaria]|nr:hypothetical protein EDC01DRAFT_636983 [Geopyxis carbonaria]